MSSAESEDAMTGSGVSPTVVTPQPLVGRAMADTLDFFHESVGFLFKATKTSLVVMVPFLLLGAGEAILWFYGILIGFQAVLVTAWAVVVFVAFTQYSLKTMMMVVLAEGLFISCALADAKPVVVTGFALAVIFPVLLSLVVVLVYDPLLHKRMLRRGKRGVLS